MSLLDKVRRRTRAGRAQEARIRREFIESAANWHGETWGRRPRLTHAQHLDRAERRRALRDA